MKQPRKLSEASPVFPAILKAAGRALGLGLLLALSYGVIGRRPQTATWVCLGAALLAYAVYTAWWDVNSKKPRLP